MNAFDEEWDETPYPTPPGWEQRTKALVPRGHALSVRLYELAPGQTQVPRPGTAAVSEKVPVQAGHLTRPS